MDTLLHKLGGIIKWSIEGFDRIVFKGILRPIAYAAGMQVFLRGRGPLQAARNCVRKTPGANTCIFIAIIRITASRVYVFRHGLLTVYR